MIDYLGTTSDLPSVDIRHGTDRRYVRRNSGMCDHNGRYLPCTDQLLQHVTTTTRHSKTQTSVAPATFIINQYI